jgi:hypothetical protein
LSGGMFVVGAGNSDMIRRAKDMITRTILGVVIILLSWTVTTFLIKTVAGANEGTPWYEFSCPAFLQTQEEALGAPAASLGSYQQPDPKIRTALIQACTAANLATAYGLPFTDTTHESAALKTMMGCIEKDPVVKALVDQNQKYTYERNNPLCNLTRGSNVCGSCQHCSNGGCNGSCHYGGKTGTNGAEAVDYNWNKVTWTYIKSGRLSASGPNDSRCANNGCRTVSSEAGLFDEISRSIKLNNCSYKFLNFEGDHTHVSTASCDMDGTGVHGRAAAILP